jgi:hypothetical protein
MHRLLAFVAVFALVAGCQSADTRPCAGWQQWSQSGSHSGDVCVDGQAPARVLANITIDPFAAAETAVSGDLLVHYQAPLVVGDDVYVLHKSGDWQPPCGQSPDGNEIACHRLDSELWSESLYSWSGSTLAFQWNAASDWKPVPSEVSGSEPLFQPVIVGDFVYLPALGGGVLKVDRHNGEPLARLMPFGVFPNPDVYVTGPLVADAHGTIYYNAIHFDRLAPLGADAKAWLVRVGSDDSVTTVPYDKIVTGAPTGTSCHTTFAGMSPAPDLPWPPPNNADSSPARPPLIDCGSQRPGINVAPAIGADGTIFTVSRAHHSSQDSFVVALKPDLTTKWVTSLRGYLADACGVRVPADGDPMNNKYDCRPGSALGVDRNTNEMPAGRVIDESSSSPVALPDGGVLYGAYTSYNGVRGHLFKIDGSGKSVATYDFGWDYTPAVWPHGGTYSIVVKDNHYGYDPVQMVDLGPYYITQLDPNLNVEWQFRNTNTKSCSYDGAHQLHCVNDHPNGFEWCINAPAIDAHGNVFAGGEDGVVYVIGQGGIEKGHLFLSMSLGATYTPLAIDHAGRLYTQNDGQLNVVGN